MAIAHLPLLFAPLTGATPAREDLRATQLPEDSSWSPRPKDRTQLCWQQTFVVTAGKASG